MQVTRFALYCRPSWLLGSGGAGFEKAFRRSWAALHQRPDAEGAWPLQSCNVQERIHEIYAPGPCCTLAGRAKELNSKGLRRPALSNPVQVCLVLESRLFQQGVVQQLQREDELSHRIAALSAQVAAGTGGMGSRKSHGHDSEDEDNIVMETHPQQVRISQSLVHKTVTHRHQNLTWNTDLTGMEQIPSACLHLSVLSIAFCMASALLMALLMEICRWNHHICNLLVP